MNNNKKTMIFVGVLMLTAGLATTFNNVEAGEYCGYHPWTEQVFEQMIFGLKYAKCGDANSPVGAIILRTLISKLLHNSSVQLDAHQIAYVNQIIGLRPSGDHSVTEDIRAAIGAVSRSLAGFAA